MLPQRLAALPPPVHLLRRRAAGWWGDDPRVKRATSVGTRAANPVWPRYLLGRSRCSGAPSRPRLRLDLDRTPDAPSVVSWRERRATRTDQVPVEPPRLWRGARAPDQPDAHAPGQVRAGHVGHVASKAIGRCYGPRRVTARARCRPTSRRSRSQELVRGQHDSLWLEPHARQQHSPASSREPETPRPAIASPLLRGSRSPDRIEHARPQYAAADNGSSGPSGPRRGAPSPLERGGEVDLRTANDIRRRHPDREERCERHERAEADASFAFLATNIT